MGLMKLLGFVSEVEALAAKLETQDRTQEQCAHIAEPVSLAAAKRIRTADLHHSEDPYPYADVRAENRTRAMIKAQDAWLEREQRRVDPEGTYDWRSVSEKAAGAPRTDLRGRPQKMSLKDQDMGAWRLHGEGLCNRDIALASQSRFFRKYTPIVEGLKLINGQLFGDGGYQLGDGDRGRHAVTREDMIARFVPMAKTWVELDGLNASDKEKVARAVADGYMSVRKHNPDRQSGR